MNTYLPPLHAVDDEVDPIWWLRLELPRVWQGPIIGPGIENWSDHSENDGAKIRLHGLPEMIVAELAWMAHWQSLLRRPIGRVELLRCGGEISSALGEHLHYRPEHICSANDSNP